MPLYLLVILNLKSLKPRWRMYDIVKIDHPSGHVFEARFSGQFQREVFFEFVDCRGEYEKQYPGDNLIVDFTKINTGPSDFGQIRSIAQYVKADGKPTGKTAIVTGDKLMRSLMVKLVVDLMSVFKQNKFAAFKFSGDAKSRLDSSTSR